jgi:ribosomal protection tetracycline resistance protein
MFSGTVRTRDRLRFSGGHEGKVTAIGVFERGTTTIRASVSAGQIAKLRGLDEIQIGDQIGEPGPRVIKPQFAPPTLESVVAARPDQRRGSGGNQL